MFKKSISVILATMMIVSNAVTCFAHERPEHDADIEYVLFGEEYYKSSHPLVKDIIQAIEDATFLCVDQYNGTGEKELDNLVNKEKIPGIIKSIDEINYTSNYTHRALTHRGWNMVYEDKAHWPLRQAILINTVKKELFSGEGSMWSFLPWVEEENNDKKIESFCVLLYYTHVLGDHLEAGEEKDLGSGKTRPKTLKEKTTGLAYIAPLAHTNDTANPGVIPDLIKYCGILFEDQASTRTYSSLVQELQKLEEQSGAIYGSTGGVNTEEKFDEYNQCAKELRNVLGMYIPMLLRNESFYVDTFMGNKAA